MATIINNPADSTGDNTGLGVILGVIIVLIVAVLLFVFGRVYLQRTNPAPSGPSGSVNIQLPAGSSGGSGNNGSNPY